MSEPYTYYLVDWNVEQTALCYAIDNNGKMGAIGRLYTMPTADNKSDIEELRALVSGANAEKSSVVVPPSVVVVDTPRRATITAL